MTKDKRAARARIELPEPYAPAGRADVLAVLNMLMEARDSKRPLSLVRLGDGEGRLLAFPELIEKAELNKPLKRWFGSTDFDDAALTGLSRELREAVRSADIIGIPRIKQQRMPAYRGVAWSIRQYDLIGDHQVLTDAAVHRYLQFGLFYRRLLRDAEFCGLITCRNVAADVQELFGVRQVAEYLVPAEAPFPGQYQGTHFPDRYEELRRSLRVPFPGALFLIGAGALGKMYCQWIKEAGGIAVDIGSIFDAWAEEGRVGYPFLTSRVYRDIPTITLGDAIRRFNGLCDELDLDTTRLSPDDYPDGDRLQF